MDTAQALTEAGKVSQAILAYNNAIKFDPKNADIRWQLGKLLLDQGRHQDAITEFKHVVNLQPDLVAARLDLARLAMRMGEKKERKKRTDSPRKKRTEKRTDSPRKTTVSVFECDSAGLIVRISPFNATRSSSFRDFKTDLMFGSKPTCQLLVRLL